MRGKASALDVLPLPCGITPAYAGKSSEDTRRSGTNGDHPRVCGEKSFENGVKGYFEGSPPRMRGKAVDCPFSLPLVGITPAYAGKSTKQAKQQDKARDHPRVCGEKLAMLWPLILCVGSPPRMRGKVPPLARPQCLLRITPAYAGKSARPSNSDGARGDHPRVCGEKDISADNKNGSKGSPPRMRGKARFEVIVLCLIGITPAYAGKSNH